MPPNISGKSQRKGEIIGPPGDSFLKFQCVGQFVVDTISSGTIEEILMSILKQVSFLLVLAQTAFSADLTTIPFESVPLDVQKMVEKENYNSSFIEVDGTVFYILSRKSGGIPQERIAHSIKLGWPKLHKLLPVNLKQATIIDYDAFLGGGPMGKFIIGIYTTSTIPLEVGEAAKLITGWQPRSTSLEYISTYYGDFTDPVQAYTDDIVIHELGHLIFGFGLTEIPNLKDPDGWFCLGMGLVYDRLVFSQVSSKPSPLFEAIVGIWKEKFANHLELDQRLINPDESKDASLGLIRLQTYGHGKSLVFLNELRKRIGESLFDSAVLKYILQPRSVKLSYDKFLEFLPSEKKFVINEVEAELKVR